MHDDTRLIHRGRAGAEHHGLVNPPVCHASTILFPTLDALEGRTPVPMSYGRHGTPTQFALAEALSALHGGAGCVLVPSGLAAAVLAISTWARTGTHLLVTDSVYGPTRAYCDDLARHRGVTVEYFDPLIGAGIEALLRPETGLVFLESPGSLTFEVQDVPAICAAAHARGVRVAIDDTWSAGYFMKPLALGADLSVQALTKYVGGHSDLMLGAVICNADTLDAVRHQARLTGNATAPDDVALALRGLRTLGTRLRQHEMNGLQLARWLVQQPQVARVLHPGRPDHPQHELWLRDFEGASGLFGVELRPCTRTQLAAFLDGLRLFGMGYSWGGFESLIIPAHAPRTVRKWKTEGPWLRIHAGLEEVEDLIADLALGFQRLAAAAPPAPAPAAEPMPAAIAEAVPPLVAVAPPAEALPVPEPGAAASAAGPAPAPPPDPEPGPEPEPAPEPTPPAGPSQPG